MCIRQRADLIRQPIIGPNDAPALRVPHAESGRRCSARTPTHRRERRSHNSTWAGALCTGTESHSRCGRTCEGLFAGVGSCALGDGDWPGGPSHAPVPPFALEHVRQPLPALAGEEEPVRDSHSACVLGDEADAEKDAVSPYSRTRLLTHDHRVGVSDERNGKISQLAEERLFRLARKRLTDLLVPGPARVGGVLDDTVDDEDPLERRRRGTEGVIPGHEPPDHSRVDGNRSVIAGCDAASRIDVGAVRLARAAGLLRCTTSSAGAGWDRFPLKGERISENR